MGLDGAHTHVQLARDLGIAGSSSHELGDAGLSGRQPLRRSLARRRPMRDSFVPSPATPRARLRLARELPARPPASAWPPPCAWRAVRSTPSRAVCGRESRVAETPDARRGHHPSPRLPRRGRHVPPAPDLRCARGDSCLTLALPETVARTRSSARTCSASSRPAQRDRAPRRPATRRRSCRSPRDRSRLRAAIPAASRVWREGAQACSDCSSTPARTGGRARAASQTGAVPLCPR